MTFTIKNLEYLPSGIFGVLSNDFNGTVWLTLQHSYLNPANSSIDYQPKVQPGTYTCIRGMHLLDGMTEPFETFEVTGVPGHSGILFHPGNTERDSSGCILLGLSRMNDSILSSRIAFQQFMNQCLGIDTFELVVS